MSSTTWKRKISTTDATQIASKSHHTNMHIGRWKQQALENQDANRNLYP